MRRSGVRIPLPPFSNGNVTSRLSRLTPANSADPAVSKYENAPVSPFFISELTEILMGIPTHSDSYRAPSSDPACEWNRIDASELTDTISLPCVEAASYLSWGGNLSRPIGEIFLDLLTRCTVGRYLK